MQPIVRRLLEKFRTVTERGFYSVKNKDNIGNSVRQVKKIDEQSKPEEKLPVCKKAVSWQIICTQRKRQRKTEHF